MKFPRRTKPQLPQVTRWLSLGVYVKEREEEEPEASLCVCVCRGSGVQGTGVIGFKYRSDQFWVREGGCAAGFI